MPVFVKRTIQGRPSTLRSLPFFSCRPIVRRSRCWLSLFALLSAAPGYAQPQNDTMRPVLPEVTIAAYEQGKAQWNTALPVAVVDNRLLDNNLPQSALQAINAIPGVRMEERSPGSYRLNIRGSAMRSPFGVRNIKVYLNNIPYTEPGGTSYINQLGLLSFRNAEIVKGPGSSMYGAGTGGVVLLQDRPEPEHKVMAGYAFGSYDLHSFFADISFVNANSTQHFSYQQTISKGYREQSRLNRATFNWNATYKLNKNQDLQTTILYGDLSYQTPGALTLIEYETNPSAARPAAGSFPSAAAAQAGIDQETVLAGVTLTSKKNGYSNRTTVYTAFTALENAAIRNYSYSQQPHGGVRTVFTAAFDQRPLSLHVHIGGELQTGSTQLDVYDNQDGRPAGKQKLEAIRTTQGFSFAQVALRYRGWELLAGGSLNYLYLDYSQSYPLQVYGQSLSYTNKFTPRISLSKEINTGIFAYGNISKGFSPPVTDELLPSGSAFNAYLQPEEGINYELGFRYNRNKRWWIDLNAYYFSLNNTIVQRRDAGGGDYYLNAGSTRQPGAELSGQYTAGEPRSTAVIFKTAYTFQPYTYGTFVRENEDYSGKALPGLPQHNVFAAVHITYKERFLAFLNYNYSSAIPLNDANLVYGKETHLLSARVSYRMGVEKQKIQLAAGMDNVLGQVYSLGFDINAAGGRYYNAAAPRNYYLQLIWERK